VVFWCDYCLLGVLPSRYGQLMNFNILNPNAFYGSQQVQKVVQPTQSEPSKERAYVEPIAPQDTVTLSQGAMKGEQSKSENHNTYDHLVNAQRISNRTIEVNNAQVSTKETNETEIKHDALAGIDTTNFLSDAMKTMVENRLGVDKEKIKEIEAMMEEIGKDESLSAQEKEKRIEGLQEMLEKEYEKAAEKQANQQQ